MTERLPMAWHVEFENGEVELWPFEEFPDGPAFGETVTALVAVGAQEAGKQEPMIDPDCICRGNWRQIVKESTPLFDKQFVVKNGSEAIYTFFGVVHGPDDYYYGLSHKDDLVLLSCVGSIEAFGYSLLAAAPAEPPRAPVAQGELPPLPAPFTALHLCGEDCALYTDVQMREYARAAVALAAPAEEPAINNAEFAALQGHLLRHYSKQRGKGGLAAWALSALQVVPQEPQDERAAFEAWWKTSEFYNLVHFEGHFRRSADAAWRARAALEQRK